MSNNTELNIQYQGLLSNAGVRGPQEGYLSNLIKGEEQPVIPSLRIGVRWQRLDHLYNVGECIATGEEHNTRALGNISALMSTSQLAHTEHPHHRRRVPSRADSSPANIRKTPWCSHWERAHSPISDEQRTTSERVQYSHCREHLPLNELQLLSVIQAALDYMKPSNAALCQTSTHTSAT